LSLDKIVSYSIRRSNDVYSNAFWNVL